MTQVYVIHADRDYMSFDRLEAQARNAKLPVQFDHMQVKQTWVEGWKGNCRNKIYRCDGAIVLLSKHTAEGGLVWELEYAENCAMPMLGVCVEASQPSRIPEVLANCPVVEWNWPEIERFIRSLAASASGA